MFEEKNEHQNVQDLNLQQNNDMGILNNPIQVYPINEQQNKPKKKRLFFIILFVVVFLLLSVAGFFWYYKGEAMYFYYKTQFPWADSIKNYKIETKFQIMIPKDSLEEAISDLIDSGLITQEQADKVKSFDSNFNISIVDKNVEIDSSSKFGDVNVLQFIIRYFYNDSIYLKADTSKLLQNIPIPDKWVYISLNNASDSFGGGFIPISQNLVNKYFAQFSAPAGSKSFDTNIIKYISITDPHESKEYNGKQLKKINFSIKQGKTNDLIAYLSEKVPKENANLVKETMSQFNNSEQNLNFSVWIDKNTKVIHGFDCSVKDFDTSKLTTSSFSKSKDKVDFNVNLNISELKNYTIEKPTDAVAIQEVFMSVFSGTTANVSTTPILTNVLKDSDSDGLLDIYEQLYNSDPNDFDTDRDGYKDGNEVINGYNPNGKKSSDKLNDDKNIFYFAYGSNMNLDTMISRCGKNNFVGFGAYLNDYNFYFYSRGYANIKPVKPSIVQGVLYKINQQCLNGLDRAEGYPNLYQRQTVKIKNRLGDFDAQVYIVQNDNTTGFPTETYFNTVIDGAIQYGLPNDYTQNIYKLYGSRPVIYENTKN